MTALEGLDIDTLPLAVEFDAPTPPARPGELDWKPGSDQPVALGERAGSQYVSLGQFSSWLHQAKILDPHAIALPGAYVLLGSGVAIVARMEQVVRQHYVHAGYSEWDFPFLVPPDALDPSRLVIPLHNALMLVGNDDDWAERQPREVLSPTGESSAYTYWARTVRNRRDLPQRMFRRARYYRPATAGRSIMRGVESADVFEFQSCNPDAETNAADFGRAVEMCRQVCADMHVPVMVSLRPPWTNNGTVADACIGVDVPLPHGATLQVGCVYDQADRFSRPYGVQWREKNERHFTRHTAGCLTRRLVLAHLFLGMESAGELLIHPVVAPIQVGITAHTADESNREQVRRLAASLESVDVRVACSGPGDTLAPGAQQRLWRRQGVPLRVYAHPRFDGSGGSRMVVVRGDTWEEAPLDDTPPLAAASRLKAALTEVGYGYDLRAYQFVAGQTQWADAGDVRDVVRERRVAVCHLEPTEAAVRAIAEWRQGEVIGFRQSEVSGPCVLSARPTRAVAYISPRT